MGELALVAFAGFFAAMVDGALGMGFGPTSSAILLTTGISPAAVSTTVNLAKVASGLAAGVSHWRLNNIDHRLVVRLAAPGAVGALIGALVLSNVDGDEIRPILAILLMFVGLRILFRFSSALPTSRDGCRRRGCVAPGAPVRRARRRGRRAGRGRHQRPGRRVGTGRHAVPAAPGTSAAIRDRVGEHRRGRGGGGFGGDAHHRAGPRRHRCRLSCRDAHRRRRRRPARGVLRAPGARRGLLGLAVAGLLLLTQSRELATAYDLSDSRWIAYLSVPAIVGLAALRPRISRWFSAPVALADAVHASRRSPGGTA